MPTPQLHRNSHIAPSTCFIFHTWLLDPFVTCLAWCVARVRSGLFPCADCSSRRLLTTSFPSPHRGRGYPGSRVCLCGPRVPVLTCLHVAGAWGFRGRPRGREVQTFLLSLLGKVFSAVCPSPPRVNFIISFRSRQGNIL